METKADIFSEELIPTLKVSVKDKYVENILKLHTAISAQSVVSSQQLVKIDLFRNKCAEASILIAESFPWVQINHTLHGLLHHSIS